MIIELEINCIQGKKQKGTFKNKKLRREDIKLKDPDLLKDDTKLSETENQTLHSGG